MKLPSKKTVTISIAAIFLVASSATAYVTTRNTEVAKVDTVSRVEEKQIPTEEIKPAEVVEITEAPVAVQDEPVVVQPPAVRTFNEIILDYPNMSSIPGFIECSSHLNREWPEMFQDHNREQNVKSIAGRFTNVCAAIDGKTHRSLMPLLKLHFEEYGAL